MNHRADKYVLIVEVLRDLTLWHHATKDLQICDDRGQDGGAGSDCAKTANVFITEPYFCQVHFDIEVLIRAIASLVAWVPKTSVEIEACIGNRVCGEYLSSKPANGNSVGKT